jgi:3-carboxy-cis,cis-muconate cycloisomerase
MPARLINALATTGPLADLFSDESVLQALLDFEAALARTEAANGVIPQKAAQSIAVSAKASAFDIPALVQDTYRAGTPAIPFTKALRALVERTDPAAASFVHWGATSQDVVDTALVLLLKRAEPLVLKDLDRIEQALCALSDQHKHTVMLGRTLLQPAPPVTFGLKTAGWFGAVRRSREALEAAFAQALLLQFGGASGTLASLGSKGPAVALALANQLGLKCPPAPWHAHRDRLAHLMCSCGVLVGSLAKIARDISLLMQDEVAEAHEPGGDGRGGSSTMPHKRNPIACTLTLAAANRVPSLVSAFLSAMVQEHERAVGGWQSEWPTVAEIVQSTGVAAESTAEVLGGLAVDPQRMLSNIDRTNGVIFAERAGMLLTETLGRDASHTLLQQATRKSASGGKHLADVLRENPEVTKNIPAATMAELETPEQYLGSAEHFRTELLNQARKKEK